MLGGGGGGWWCRSRGVGFDFVNLCVLGRVGRRLLGFAVGVGFVGWVGVYVSGVVLVCVSILRVGWVDRIGSLDFFYIVVGFCRGYSVFGFLEVGDFDLIFFR